MSPSSQATRPRHVRFITVAATLSIAVLATAARADTPASIEAAYATQAGSTPSAARGQAFFTTTHGGDWRCASCHGPVPVAAGRHASTGKPIPPLAPAADARRFSDPAKVEKWFRRNCRDVLERECSAGEKADVIAWLRTLQP